MDIETIEHLARLAEAKSAQAAAALDDLRVAVRAATDEGASQAALVRATGRHRNTIAQWVRNEHVER